MPTILLIHGGLWEETDADWFWRRTGIVAGLEGRGFRVIAPNRLRRASSWADEARHVAAALAPTAPAPPDGPVTVIGGSFGCSVAVRLALDFPALVGRLLLAWPGSAEDQFVAIRVRADLARLGARPAVLNALLGGGVLPGTPEAELRTLALPVGVLPTAPPNPVHPRSAVDALLRLLPFPAELPGCPEAPRPDFGPHLESFLATVAAFAIPRLPGVLRSVSMTEHVLVAPDKFKGSLSAAEVAARVASGLARAGFAGEAVRIPVADGGDGTVDAAVSAGYRRIEIGVRGPVGRPVTAAFGLLEGTAVIEAAQACGLSLVPPESRAPLTATSRGVGELILAAVRMKATRIVLGLGGVATTDGGAGLVQALGARLTDEAGLELPPGGGALARLGKLDLSRMRDLSGVEFLVASDVDNPLLGPHGAAAVYAPQKGASDDDVAVLEAGLTRWADIAERTCGRLARDEAGAGAAGGLGFAALLFLRAWMRPGIALLLDMLSFGARLDGARLVITGEGALDAQTLRGKAPAGVARAAAAHDPAVPVVAVAGVSTLSPAELSEAGIAAAYALSDIEPDVSRSFANAGPLVEELAGRIAADWLR